jgi:putative ABC transport system permease protein
VENLIRDLHYAFTAMRRAPALTATVLITFALGIGTTTGMFSVVHGMLLRPLPYPDPDGLVQAWEEHPGGTPMAGQRRLSNRTASAWSPNSRTIEALGGYYAHDLTVSFRDQEPMKLPGSSVSPAVFGMLRARPAIGRFFTADEARKGSTRVVVLSDQLWRERFGASPEVLGRTLTIGEDPHTIVGVARPGLEFPDRRVLLWIPYVIPDVTEEGTSVFNALARLRSGVTRAQAAAEGTAAARSMPRPQSADLAFGKGGPVVVHVQPFSEYVTAGVQPALVLLTAAVLLLLSIACANVANLLLSRGLARERELAIRLAVGASRARLLRQLLTESVTLSTAGGLIGLLLAWTLVRLLPILAPERLPRIEEVQVDAAVLGFSITASLLAGLVAGLAPALRAARSGLTQSIRVGEGSSTVVRGREAQRLRFGLLVIEVALAVVLVVGATLLARSFARLLSVDAGYRADGVLTAAVRMPRGATPEQTAQYIDAVLARLGALPAITVAGAGSMMPFADIVGMSTFSIPEWAAAGKPTRPRALTYIVTPGYAEALSLRIKEGRFFEAADRRSGPRRLVVNEEFVHQYIGRKPVVGLQLGSLFRADAGIETEIVGVVGNVRRYGNDRAPEPEVYFMHDTGNRRIAGYVNFVLRTSGPPSAAAGDVRAVLQGIDRSVIIDRIDPLTTLVARSVARPRFGLTIMSTFAALALVLAAVGLYGALSYGVSQRRRELGVRAALGADRGRLVALVLREGLAVVAAGTLVGVVAAALLTRTMQTLLFGISPFDLLSYASALSVLLLAALVAALVPAWRAATTDPAAVLRA